MANELTVTLSLKFTKDNIALPAWAINAAQFTVSGTNYVENVQTIGTSAEALVLGDVGTPGWGMFKNLDPTNYVQIYPDNSGSAPLVRLKAGESAIFRLDSTTPYAKANTSPIQLQYRIIAN